MLGGDFNCVQNTQRDRWHHDNKPRRSESPALDELCHRLGVHDALDLAVEEPDETRAPHEHSMYWSGAAASRIDRFYVATAISELVQWKTAELPKRQSDHHAVVLTLRLARRHTRSKTRRQQRLAYPIKTAHPEKTLEQLRRRVREIGAGAATGERLTWAEGCARIKDDIKRLGRAEKRRVQAGVQRMKRQERKPRNTRAGLIAAGVAKQAAQSDTRFGISLQSSHAYVRSLFQKVSNWTRDQTVTAITPRHGATTTSATVADAMAGAWMHILSQEHAAMRPAHHERLFDAHVKIPKNRRVAQEWNIQLNGVIGEGEVLRAIDTMAQHKAPGLDQLPNDLFKDCGEQLAPWLVPQFSDTLSGVNMPASFSEGLVIPLRKNGDSNYALDYRPIALLQACYKVFAKVIANRVQAGLRAIIGGTQQGFVRSRQLERSVTLMQAERSVRR